jgi:hypothetical protein
MNPTLARNAGIGLLILLTILTGLSLSRMGRPHNVLISTAHKLVALGALVLLILAALRTNQAAGLSVAQMAVAGAAVLFFVGSIASGGVLMAVNGPAPLIVRQVHRYLPILTFFASAGSLFVLVGGPV